MLEFLSFLVNCPRDAGQRYKMTMIYSESNGTRFFYPCNGCDWSCGLPVCSGCISSLNQIFQKNPYLDISSPITPLSPDTL